jgi:hypothetical protein
MMNFSKLRGKLIQVYRDGVRVGRVVRVNAGPRKGLRSLRLASPRYEGNDRWSWRGPQYTVDGRELHARGSGVIYRKRVVPIDEFIRKGDRRCD